MQKQKHNRTYAQRRTRYQRAKLFLKIKLSVLLVALIAGVLVISYGWQFAIADIPVPEVKKETGFPRALDKKELSVTDKITIAALKNKIDLNTALNIAYCENQEHDPEKRNSQGSTATGIYQFTMSTWWNYCEGDVKNADDNIACFVKLYPKHKGWWECAKILSYAN